jgi:hypothetical protein
MSKVDKIIDKWRRKNYTQDADVSDVELVLEEYFENYIVNTSGSHLFYIQHDLLVGVYGFKSDGSFTIPVKSGRYVKKVYYKTLLKAIDIIEENSE